MPETLPRFPARAPCVPPEVATGVPSALADWDSRLSRDSAAKWAFLAGIALLDAIWLRLAHFDFVLAGSYPAAICASLLLLAAWGLGRLRRDPRIFCLCDALAQMIMACALCVTLSYLVVATDRPLVDPLLAAGDRALGLDWPRLVGWIQARPGLDHLLVFVYGCSGPQALLLALFLSYRQQERVAELAGTFLVGLFAAVVICGFLPAAGAYSFFGQAHPDLVPEMVMPDFEALRQGILRSVDLGRPEGLVSFPSFHTIMLIIFTYVTRRTPWLFVASLLFNGAVLVSTLTTGGHYVTDVIGGGVIAAASILAYDRFWRRAGRSASAALLQARADDERADPGAALAQSRAA